MKEVEELKGLKIGVLGYSGFLGTTVMEACEEYGLTAMGASRGTGVDCRYADQLVDWIKSNKIDVVINLAADCGGIGLNRKHPARLWAAATMLSHGVLEACRICEVRKVVMLGTVCSYAKDCPVPFKEEDLMKHGFPEITNSGYGVAKLNGIFGAMAYRKEYGLNAISLIPVNLYGPHDHFDLENSHVIPALIRKCLEAKASGSESMKVWGTGSATREFLYSKDCARAILMAAAQYDSPDPVNVGYGQEISIRDLVGKIKKITGYDGEISWDDKQPDGQPRRCLDVTKAERAFGFKAEIGIDEGLTNVINWYEKTRC